MIDLHIIQNEKVTIPTIETYRHQFSADNNPFVIFGGSHTNNYLKYENVEKLREDFLGTVQLLKKMKNMSQLRHKIFHGQRSGCKYESLKTNIISFYLFGKIYHL